MWTQGSLLPLNAYRFGHVYMCTRVRYAYVYVCYAYVYMRVYAFGLASYAQS